MQFQAHGIKTSQALEKAWYMISTLTNGRKCVTVCAQEYRPFSAEVRKAFAVENATDSMTDYFEQDSFRVFPEHPLFHEVAAGFRKMLTYRLKVSKRTDYARQTLEALNKLCGEAHAAIPEANGKNHARANVIAIRIHRGLITAISGLHRGYELHVEDYDVDDRGHTDWNPEKQCVVTVYHADFAV